MKILYRRIPLIILNMGIILIITTIFVFSFEEYFNLKFPEIWNFFAQMALVVIFDDTYFYFFHKLLHKNKFLYRHIHSKHHAACAPYPLEFLYVHPLEHIFGSVGAIIGFVIAYFIFGSINIYVFWGYYLFRTLHETHIHSGIKSDIFHWMPFYGSNQHHDDHHAKLHGNYASTLSFWDWALGTKIEKKEEPKAHSSEKKQEGS
jgi:sterol desaturase/sphingolipid hydroxylase (fatty acid hydroxylase superfamily)